MRSRSEGMGMQRLPQWISSFCVLISLSGKTFSQTRPLGASTRPLNPARVKEQYRSFAKMHDGDAERGKVLFFNEQRLACSRCHVVNSQGGSVGPDLSTAGDKFGRLDLIDAVLSPSATIAVGYSTTVVKTKAGQIIEGIVKEANDGGVSLAGADGKGIRVKSDEIQEQRTVDRSLMPEELYTGLSMPAFADLIAYMA